MSTVTANPVEIPSRVRIGNISIDRVDVPQALESLRRAIEQKRPTHVVTANLQFISTAEKNLEFASTVDRAGLVVADGMPLLWLARLARAPLPERITGHDLVHLYSKEAATRGYRVFLFGGAPGCAEAAGCVLVQKYPGLQIVGIDEGMVGPDGEAPTLEAQIAERQAIRDARPDILFVALGCPKQEFWIARHLHELDVPIMVGVGSVFDVLAGVKKRSPAWMQKAGLEWAYRLGQEPGRLWKRYLMQDLPTVLRLAVNIAMQTSSPETRRAGATAERQD